MAAGRNREKNDLRISSHLYVDSVGENDLISFLFCLNDIPARGSALVVPAPCVGCSGTVVSNVVARASEIYVDMGLAEMLRQLNTYLIFKQGLCASGRC